MSIFSYMRTDGVVGWRASCDTCSVDGPVALSKGGAVELAKADGFTIVAGVVTCATCRQLQEGPAVDRLEADERRESDATSH